MNSGITVDTDNSSFAIRLEPIRNETIHHHDIHNESISPTQIP